MRNFFKTMISISAAIVLLLTSFATYADPPSESGPNVIRYDAGVGLFFIDPDAGTSVVMGGNVAEFCQGGGLDVVSVMRVNVPQDTDRIKRLISGNVQASVWPFTTFDCNLYITTLPTAEGMVHLRNNDNDLVSFLRDNNNINSYGWKANGAMYSPLTGERYQFNFIYHALFRDLNDDDPSNDEVSEMIKFALH